MAYSSSTPSSEMSESDPKEITNQIINDVFLNQSNPTSPFSPFDIYNQQALEAAALQDEYRQFCLTNNIPENPNITILELKALAGSTITDLMLIHTPLVNSTPNNPLPKHSSTYIDSQSEMNVDNDNDESLTSKRPHSQNRPEEMALEHDEEGSPTKVRHLSSDTTQNPELILKPQSKQCQTNINNTIQNPNKDAKRDPKTCSIPENALKNRYSPNHLYKTYDVIFQADQSQTQATGLSDVRLAKVLTKIFEEANIRTETTTSTKVGQSIRVTFASRDSANLMIDHQLLKSHKIIAYIRLFTIQTQGIIQNVPLEFTKDEILKYSPSTPNIIDAVRCQDLSGTRIGTQNSKTP